MSDGLRVRVFAADEGACGHYRLRWPVKALAAFGMDAALDEGIPGVRWEDKKTGRYRIIGVGSVDADVVVLQRPLNRDLADVVPHLQAAGVAVVVEVDDDFHSIPRENSAWRDCEPRFSPDRNYHHLARACEAADLVTVTTPALARRYASHGRCAIIPNCVPAGFLDVAHADSPIIGWAGSVHTHPGDLEQVGGMVARVANQVRIVGPATGIAARLKTRHVEATGWVNFNAYPLAVAHIGVGIVPLAPTAFNEAKSWLKGLEYAALGVPFIASPTGPYRQLNDEGAGLLAATPRDWLKSLRHLTGNAAYRLELSERGRRVAERWTIEGNAHRWWDAWTLAAARRHSNLAGVS